MRSSRWPARNGNSSSRPVAVLEFVQRRTCKIRGAESADRPLELLAAVRGGRGTRCVEQALVVSVVMIRPFAYEFAPFGGLECPFKSRCGQAGSSQAGRQALE